MVRVVSVGGAVQDVFLSQSPEFNAVCERPEECFIRLELGAKADVNNIHFSTGGGATNAAVTFARQGFDSTFMGVVGDDPAAQAVLAELDKEGVDTQHVRVSKKYHTGYSVLLLAPSGERTILTYRGASTHYSKHDIASDNIDADWIYMSSMSGQMEIVSQILAKAKQRGVKVMYNPGKKELAQPDKLRALLEDVDVLTVNKQEMQSLVDGEDLEELVKRGLNYVPCLLVTDGPNGVVASDGKTIIRAGLYEDSPSIDRTGAGDAFGSGFLSQYAKGETLKDSIIFASANSSSVVGYIGAKTGILRQNVKLHGMPLYEKAFKS